ncbi:hypothetical protein CAL14_01230 [Bordetella genomosp. 9]|uniref:penicillin acylase family protein n=1 Tax=Bordetella genomosp. 9 TaxID=1416803 RepID=UPI000A2919EB|nr:penicillin acylase family protein [Bordetella genomosp. 9]ARP89089.1 hypothetical protein CAL14_01230 [Bordetella genomosp. 9]
MSRPPLAPRNVRRWGRVAAWCALAVSGVVILAAAAVGWAWWASLPQLDGDIPAQALAAPAFIERDDQGSVTVIAANRPDLAYGTGYAHGQDRFFQMDLLRRVAAGEVAALVGPDAVEADVRHRMHRFRARAHAAYNALPPAQRALLQRYADGVNAALAALPVWPFEYGLLGVRPEAWQPEDTFLVIDAMYLDLQSGELQRVLSRGFLRDAVSKDMLAFLTPPASAMDAPLDGASGGPTSSPPMRIPQARPDWLDGPGRAQNGAASRDAAACGSACAKPSTKSARAAAGPAAAVLAMLRTNAGGEPGTVGSNAFAVAGSRSADRAARVANDMHLGLRLPNIWYRLTLVQQGEAPRQISGVSLPGAPVVVAGSNGDVAWGFTNSYGHFIDLVRLERDPADPARYRGADGKWETATVHDEWIKVKGGAPVRRPVYETRWGPVFSAGGQDYAVRWIAYRADAADLGLLGMETARDVTQAMRVAHSAGVPTQNMLVADRGGQIGWTLAGPLPDAVLDPAGYPVDAAALAGRALPPGPPGRLAAADTPRILNPPSGLLWTANGTQLSDAARQARIGDGGADVGLRGGQMRDGLLALSEPDEKALLGIQLDDRGLWLEFWRDLALESLDAAALAGHADRAAFRRILTQWNGRADADQAGYTLVRDFRETLYGAWFAGLDERLSARAPELAPAISLGRASSRLEAVMRTLARQRAWVPARHAGWRDFMLAVIDETIQRNRPRGAPLAHARWGERNVLALAHPFAALLPHGLRPWFSAPAEPMPGDINMPRVQRPAFGASERFVVGPGREAQGILHMPGGASGHPLSPFYLAGHEDWVRGTPSPFLPGPAAHKLVLQP